MIIAQTTDLEIVLKSVRIRFILRSKQTTFISPHRFWNRYYYCDDIA